MRRLDSLAALNIVLSWLSSPGEAQTLPEILSPCTRSPPCFTSVHTAAAASHSPSGTGPTYLAIVSTPSSISNATSGSESNGARSILRISSSLGSISPTAAPLLASPTSSSSPQPASTSGSDDDPSTMTHIPSPVAMVAGCLAGSIVIVAALLVFFVVRRRKKRRRRLLHEVMNQSWAARLAARHLMADGGEDECDGGVGIIPGRDARRPSRAPSISRPLSTISTLKKPSKSNHLLSHSSKARYSPRHARTSLETEDLELSSRRTSISLCPSSSASPTLPPPTVVVTLHDESDVPMAGGEPCTTHALTSSSAPRPASRGPSTACTRETSSSTQPGDGRSHARDGCTASSVDLTAPTSTSSSSPSASQGAAATMGKHADEIVGVDFATAEGEKRQWKLGPTHAGEMDGGRRSNARPTARSVRDEFVLEDMPPAYADVR